MRLTATEIAQQLGGEVLGDGSIIITGFAQANDCKPGDLTFAENEEYFARAEQSPATAILVSGNLNSKSKTLIRVPNARVAFARVLPLFFPERVFAPGIHPSAVVAASAQVDPSAHIGPLCVLEENVRIGPRTVLEGGNHIGPDCVIGEDCHLFPRVVLYARVQLRNRVRLHGGVVIGSDGFGYVFDAGAHRKIPQVGVVVIEDDVEIGANSTVDRAALGTTLIGKGTKIDNLVQIAHNVVVGKHCIIVAQAGVAGSASLGDYVTLAGQVGIVGHLKIGNRVTVGGQSGVMHNIPDGERWFGYPAQPDRQSKRQIVALHQLPELVRRVQELEKKLKDSAAPAKAE